MAKANILFVEDSKTQGVKTKDFLEKSGYAVTWVMDGMSVFRLTKTRPFDVILLDRVLPDMDGNKVCTWRKQNEDTKGIQIIRRDSEVEKNSGPCAGPLLRRRKLTLKDGLILLVSGPSLFPSHRPPMTRWLKKSTPHCIL